jgi:peptidoglycan/LPS O-acetylase OafA/YrhL
MEQLRTGEIRPLTALRFFAALWVLLYHVHTRWPLVGPGPLDRLLRGGTLGVSLFFVLSGFVLTHRYVNRGEREKGWVTGYLRRRIARIYPLYLVGLILVLPFLWLPALGPRPGDTLAAIVANLLLVQAWIPHLAVFWYGSLAWSVGAEAFFYVMFPVMARKLHWASPRDLRWVLALAILGSGLVDVSQGITFGYVLPVLRLSEFVAGCLAARLVAKGWHPRHWTGPAAALSVAGYLAVLGPWLGEAFPDGLIVVPAFLILVSWLCRPHRVARALSSAWLVSLGRSSYAFFILQLCPLALALTVAPPASQPSAWLVGAGVVTVNLVLASMAHRWIEVPCYHYLTRSLAAERLQPGKLVVGAQIAPGSVT